MNYQEAEAIMAVHITNVTSGSGVMRKLDPYAKKLDRCSWLSQKETNNGEVTYTITLFGKSSTILTFHIDYLEINDGGWFSKTTLAKLNEYMPRGFRVWGQRYPYVPVTRPLGFVKTPRGTYPYNMPFTVDYRGVPAVPNDSPVLGRVMDHNEELTDVADKVIEALPNYVNNYLAKLLQGFLESTIDRRQFDHAYWAKDWGKFILTNTFHGELATSAIEFNSDATYAGLTLQEIVHVLLKEGHDAFKRAISKNHTAHRTERILLHGLPMPTIPANWIKKTLRPLIHEHLLELLGFDEVHWNRRDQ